MKTFKTLSIGDVIYRLCDTYELGKPDKTQVHKIIIESLSIDTKNGNLLINQVHPYSGGSYWSIIISSEKLNRTYYRFEPKENAYRSGLYFVNESDANYIVRRAVIRKINDIEKSIPETIKARKTEITDLREAFYEILNPSFHPEYSII